MSNNKASVHDWQAAPLSESVVSFEEEGIVEYLSEEAESAGSNPHFTDGVTQTVRPGQPKTPVQPFLVASSPLAFQAAKHSLQLQR